MKSPVSYKRAIEIVAKREFDPKHHPKPDELKTFPTVQLIADLFEVDVESVANAVRGELDMRVVRGAQALLNPSRVIDTASIVNESRTNPTLTAMDLVKRYRRELKD